MSLYRKKPVVIEAYQLPAAGADVPDSFHEWCDRVGFTNYTSGRDETLVISTLEGDMTAEPGDWIIKGVKGEFYPCKPDIFAATYEPANESSTMQQDMEWALQPLVDATAWSDFVSWAREGGYDESYFNRWDSKSQELQRQYLEEMTALRHDLRYVSGCNGGHWELDGCAVRLYVPVDSDVSKRRVALPQAGENVFLTMESQYGVDDDYGHSYEWHVVRPVLCAEINGVQYCSYPEQLQLNALQVQALEENKMLQHVAS